MKKKCEENEETSFWGGYYGKSSHRNNRKDNSVESGTRRDRTSCCVRFKAEIHPCQDWFLVADSGSSRKLDIPESFAPEGKRVILWKTLATGLTIGTLLYTWTETGNPDFYLAYVTSWSLLASSLYMTLSFFNTILASRTPQPPERATGRIKATWIFYVLATHGEMIVTVLYWWAEYTPDIPIHFANLAPHGGVLMLIFFDGVWVNRIPIRWMHWWGLVLPFDCSYLLWTIIHAFLDIGNPNKKSSSAEMNDDAIYRALEWQTDWQEALIMSILVVCVVGPVLFFAQWMLTLYLLPCCCVRDQLRYLDSPQQDNKANISDVEEGSIFAKWG
jgi:hypothetical protein